MILTAYIHVSSYNIESPIVFDHDMSNLGYIVLGKHEFEFDMPGKEVTIPKAVAALKAKQERIRTEALKNVADVEQEIKELLCLEYKPE